MRPRHLPANPPRGDSTYRGRALSRGLRAQLSPIRDPPVSSRTPVHWRGHGRKPSARSHPPRSFAWTPRLALRAVGHRPRAPHIKLALARMASVTSLRARPPEEGLTPGKATRLRALITSVSQEPMAQSADTNSSADPAAPGAPGRECDSESLRSSINPLGCSPSSSAVTSTPRHRVREEETNPVSKAGVPRTRRHHGERRPIGRDD